MSEPEFHRDRRQHGGAAQRLDEDKLAELTEDERVDAGLDDFNPDEVPPATDPLPEGVPQRTDVRQSAEYKDAQAEIEPRGEGGRAGQPRRGSPVPAHSLRQQLTQPAAEVDGVADRSRWG